MDSKHLPIIDWELAMQMAGKNRDIAEEILALLIKTLPDDLSAINQSYDNQQYHELAARLHKLHGALCYCGLPRLKTVVIKLENDVKNNHINDLSILMDTLNDEAKLLLEQYKLKM